MKPWQINIIIITGTLFIIFIPQIPNEIMSLIIFTSLIWVYVDAKKLDIGKYKPTFFGRGPLSYALCINVLWILGLPFYVDHRQKIIDGKWPLKETDSQKMDDQNAGINIKNNN